MGENRTILREPVANQRRPAAAAAVRRTAAVVPQSPSQVLHRRLGNQRAQALISRSVERREREPAAIQQRDAATMTAPRPAVRSNTTVMPVIRKFTAPVIARVAQRVPQPAAAVPRTMPMRAQATPQLSISSPGDTHEREADRVADIVMRMAEPRAPETPRASSTPSGPIVQRKCTNCEEERENKLKVPRKETTAAAPQVTPEVAANISALKGGGTPLPVATRAFFEPRFGADFSHVRVHTDTHAVRTASSISAKAFTVGQDIAFAYGQYTPESYEGQRLLAHELTHVVQQDAQLPRVRTHRVTPTTIQRQPQNPPPTVGAGPSHGGGGAAAGGRVVYIDSNIVIQINQGNQAVANALRQMRAAGVELRISPYQRYELVTRPDIPRTATAQRLILEEMNIRVGALPSLAQRVDVNIAGATRSGGNIMQLPDQNMVASARADGRNVEIWSLDTPFTSDPRQVERTYRVRVAPESQLRVTTGQPDYRVGRQLLGLEPVQISLMGEVTRGTPRGGGTAPGGGGPPAPPAPGTSGTSTGRSAGVRAVAAGVGIIVVINDILGGLNRVRNIQQYNIDIGNAELSFWERFGASPVRGVWDVVGRHPLPVGTTPSTSRFGSPSYPYVVDIDVNALRRNLPHRIDSYQDYLYFLDAAKMLGAIEEDPILPERPSQEQRIAARRYYVWVNRPDRQNRRIYDVTDLMMTVRNAALGELSEAMRAQARTLTPQQQENIYRLKRGPDTRIYRSAGGLQPILTSAQIFGADPWVRSIGRREDVGSWFSTDIRVLVVPANADAQRAGLISGYWVKQSIEDTLDEVRQGGRPILDRQPTEGPLNSFVAGPEPGGRSRFGQTRYYRHRDPSVRWTIALGELHEFWVAANDLEPVPRATVDAYGSSS